MNNIPQISDAEWQIMRIIWRYAPITAKDVIEKLDGHSDWKPKTIKTLLRRLVDKHAITYTVADRAYIYTPLIGEDECIVAETDSFLEKVYSGSFSLFVQSFIDNQKLSKNELEELRGLLEKNVE